MSRLQVGDIRIDGSNVSIGGTQLTGAQASGTQVAATGQAALAKARGGGEHPARALARIPVSSRMLAAGGAVALAVGVAANTLFAAWNDPIGALVRGGFLAPLGFGLLALAAARHFVLSRPEMQHRAALGGDPEPYLEKLAPLLALPRPEQTIEWISRRTGWNEDTVVHALALLRERGLVEEELDLQTGEFYYVHTPKPSLGPRDLNTRLGDLNP